MAQQTVDELSSKLREHRSQLESVEEMLLRRSNDESLLKLRDDLKQVIKLAQDLYTLRVKQEEETGTVLPSLDAIKAAALKTSKNWCAGERCIAKWSQDHKWYSARVTSVDQNDSIYDVIFLDYGNTDRVAASGLRLEPRVSLSDLSEGLKCRALYATGDATGLFYNAIIKQIIDDAHIVVNFTDYKHDGTVKISDLKLLATKKKRPSPASNESLEKMIIPEKLKPLASDSDLERMKKRKRVKAIKNKHRQKKLDHVSATKQSSWQTFRGGKSAKLKDSIFKTPDNFSGKVGVVGSGNAMTEYHTIGKFKRTESMDSS